MTCYEPGGRHSFNTSCELMEALESAKKQGNQLAIEQIKGLVQAARETADLTMRTAASQALGALNLKLNEASEIIRAYHRG